MLKLNRVRQLRTTYKRCLAGQSQLQLNSTDAEPVYPEIQDTSFKARKQKDAANWHEEIRQVPTVEEKMIKINMPRYYGFKVVDFNDSRIPYNALPLTQHYTRTVLEDLPSETEKKAQAQDSEQEQQQPSEDGLFKAARGDVIDALEFAHDYYKHLEKQPNSVDSNPVERERILTQIIVEQLNRALLQSLSEEYKHLDELEVDYNPRHEAFWAVGGVDPPKNVQKSKKGREWQKDMANDSVDRLVQYTGAPYLALRHRKQLSPWKTEAESENLELSKQLPRFKHDPRTLGYSTKHQHATNIRPKSFGEQDQLEALHSLAIKSSYAWLLAQANYNGLQHLPTKLTYPMNTQTVITNGREWSFYEYQLNTLLLHGTNVAENPRVNFCRGTKPLPLYAEISASGKCVDFNDTALRHLLNFYANAPSIQRSIGEQQPYVASDVSAYENAEQRDFINKTFKYLASNRPRHLELPEIYLWEKLYKIDNKNRAMEAKRRFFELNINPWQRTLDTHDKEYVPRAVRPDVPKNKNRFKKTYYP
ncbi:GM22582 [Drosophila sechellia]|uniref:GM22582 n=1 Tax=Drosophila sechellia TaxID=7238 RepID=B4IKD2_DROSE|nr:GM22582 [Drosophila sechellia]